MTRDELNHFIKRVEKDIHMSDGLRFQPGLSVSAELLRIKYWFEDIRDNGITELKKYRILVKHIENSYYEMWLFYEGDGVFNTVSDKAEINTVRSFTRTQIEDLKKNDDVAIDWNKAVIAVGEDK